MCSASFYQNLTSFLTDAAALDRLFTEPKNLSELAATDLIALLNTSFEGNVILEHNAKKAAKMLTEIKEVF